jgi:hypothetical protein|tara:strand:- start:362 stop:1114 length:753 start_codon:yes stop_codon:yes gene_type:complete
MEKIKVEYTKPFGPGILKGNLPDKILKGLLNISQDVIDKKITKWNRALVGAIKDEWKIPELLYKDYKVDGFLKKVFETYALAHLSEMREAHELTGASTREYNPEIEVKIGDGWINYMKEHEYNPIHFHSNCTLSSIFYLNDYCGDEPIVENKNMLCEDGFTNFVNGSSVNGSVLSDRPEDTTSYRNFGKLASINNKTHISVKPKQGLFFVFPQWLLHQVNPFKGKGVRITASINCGIRYLNPNRRLEELR